MARLVTAAFTAVMVFVALVSGMAGQSFAWPVPGTGQTTCYNEGQDAIQCPNPGQDFYGQDGNYLISPPSFTKLDAQGDDLPDTATSWDAVRDNVTGLIWDKKSLLTVNGFNLSFDMALNLVKSPQVNMATNPSAGYRDWRLPTVWELQSIVNYARTDPALVQLFFPTMKSDWYWTSTPRHENPDDYWVVNFAEGTISAKDKGSSRYIIVVRSEDSPERALVDNGDGTVTDLNTGLMWQKETPSDTYAWKEALAYAEGLVLAGHGDWRLPTVKELFSLVDPDRSNPAIATVFGTTSDTPYWSSTTYAHFPVSAWYVSFHDSGLTDPSYVQQTPKGFSLSVRAVRAGQAGSPGPINIVSPEVSSLWAEGDEMPITWYTRDIGGNVTLAISRDGGENFENIASGVPNNGSYSWTVTAGVSDNCVIRIVPLIDPSRQASQGPFSIVERFILSYSAAPAKGSIEGESSQAVLRGDDGAPVFADANPGYRFARWSDGVTDNPRQDTDIQGSISVEALFSIDLYWVIAILQVLAGMEQSVDFTEVDFIGEEDLPVDLSLAIRLLQCIGEMRTCP